jgi:iron(III) transport system substrate-binding protein
VTRLRAHLASLLPLSLLLAVPFLLRPRDLHRGTTGTALIVLTPHNEAITSEFGASFRAFMQREHGTAVTIDWRNTGGASEISRYLSAQYAASFRREWTGRLGQAWTPVVASSFADPRVGQASGGVETEAQRARRTFLASNVSAGADVLFGGGSSDFVTHAAAGRLVSSRVIADHPEVFNPAVVPSSVGGEPYWDEQGRWVGVCLAGFGICYNPDSIARIGVHTPAAWSDLADPAYAGQLALADPTKSGSAVKAFEMLIQQQMQMRVHDSDDADLATREAAAAREGWTAAMRLIRRIAANARYFTDSAFKIPMDIADGDAAAGTCIDFFGRFQAETVRANARPRLAFITPRGGSSLGADPVAVLRGAPHRELAEAFIAYLVSEEGQKLWNYRVGAPGGPARHALRRLPILPSLYDAPHRAYLSDPEARPYENARAFHYRPEWTAHLFRSIGFVIRVMCVEPHEELARAYQALVAHRGPPRASALFDDVTRVDYARVTGPIRAALAGGATSEVTLSNEMIRAFRRQYDEVTALAEAGQ